MKKLLILIAVASTLLPSCRRERGAVGTYKNAPVIVISIDTLRSDHLPMYGYRGVETPNLSAFRKDAVLFTNAFSHVPLTLPSHVSLLTGLLPPQNGVRNNIGYTLKAGLPTIPTFLKARGYDTGAAISAFVLRGSSGLGREFDFYDDDIAAQPDEAAGSVQRSGRTTLQVASHWLDGRSEKPFFFLFHIFEPHSPYEPEEPFRARYASAPYDGEIATADAIVGAFLDDLKRRGIYDRAIIVLLSDHGEGLSQHGEPEHGIFVYREDIHVPLMIKLPKSDSAGTTIDAPAGLVDVFPTIAQLVGAPAPPNLSGRSLFAPAAGPRDIYSESLYARIHLGWSELRSLTDGRYHYIQAPKPELYDMQSDPAERQSVLTNERRVYSRMRDALVPYVDKAVLATKVDPEEAKKLAALGYLSSTSTATGTELPDPKDRIGEIGDMMRAVALMNAGRTDDAIAAFRKIVAVNPRLADAWTELGSALEKAGRYEEAADVYKKAIAGTPELAGEMGLRCASMLLYLEKHSEAESYARLAEKSNPGGSHLVLARIALSAKQYPKAISLAQSALSEDASSRIGAELVTARAFAQQNRTAEAQQALDRASADMERQKSGPVQSYEFTRGDILARTNRYGEAVAAFQREIDLFPRNRQAYANLYLVYLLLNREAEASQTLDSMVRAIPSRDTMLFAAKTAQTLGQNGTAAVWGQRAKAEAAP